MTLPKLFFLYSISAAALLFEPVVGSGGISPSRVRRDKHPSMPIASGTTEDCSFWYDNTGAIDCEYMPAFWSTTMEEFLKWNPSITNCCENFQEGYSYCVEGKAAAVTTPTDTTTSQALTTTTAACNGIVTHSPIENGAAKNCNQFHLIKSTYLSDMSEAKVATYCHLLPRGLAISF